MRRFQEDAAPLSSQINLTPLIDMVFILLIFFIVTSKFTKESGVDVSRPEASTATSNDQANIVVGITAQGEVWIDGQAVAMGSVRAQIERLHAANPKGAVILVVDKATPTGVTVEVLDHARLAGASNVSIAASPKGGQ